MQAHKQSMPFLKFVLLGTKPLSKTLSALQMPGSEIIKSEQAKVHVRLVRKTFMAGRKKSKSAKMLVGDWLRNVGKTSPSASPPAAERALAQLAAREKQGQGKEKGKGEGSPARRKVSAHAQEMVLPPGREARMKAELVTFNADEGDGS